MLFKGIVYDKWLCIYNNLEEDIEFFFKMFFD